MSDASSPDRAWIASELIKGIEAERSLAKDLRARADSPPDSALGVIYNEIATADERHAAIVETIAIRYGHTPTRSSGGGVGRAWVRLKDSLGELGSSALDHLIWDLTAKAQSVHWHAAWAHALDAIGDPDSARELMAVLTEEELHRDALRQALNRLVEQQARGNAELAK
jgi:hypothetical protein